MVYLDVIVAKASSTDIDVIDCKAMETLEMERAECERLTRRDSPSDHPVDIVELAKAVAALEIPLLGSSREEAW